MRNNLSNSVLSRRRSFGFGEGVLSGGSGFILLEDGGLFLLESPMVVANQTINMVGDDEEDFAMVQALKILYNY